MATTFSDTVNAYYLAYYGRPADPAGLAYWTSVLEKSNGDASSIVSAFSTSAEATARFGGASASDRISDVYQQLFGRAPDKAGLDYWTKAIESGQMSVANAAINIMNGAQKTDEQTSTLRQQVAADFTAEVKASGVAYDGAAAIEAARVLISAVNADSKPADLANLVKAGASLVQTAHDNPDVIKALANGGDLSAVLNTASGKADPVAVVQAMASIGKAALTDSAGLSSLLQGGGMSGLLNSLPAGTSVKDVVTAVSNGGLSAGADVAKPPVDVPVTPPVVITPPTIAFVGAHGEDLPADTTLVANSIWYFIDVHGIPSGAHTTVFEVATAASPNVWQEVPEDIDLADGTYFVRYTVKDAAGNSGSSNALKLVMDHSVPFLNMALAEDTGTSSADRISSKGAVKISGLHANETWFYSFDNKSWVQGTADANGQATIADSGAIGKQSLVVRTLENVNGNSQFTSTALNYTIDKTAPGQGLKLVSVGGTAGAHTELAKGDVVFSYTGTIDLTKAEALFYRINTNIWSSANGTIIDDVNKTVTFKDVDLSHGPVQIVIQTKDTAGNVLDLTTTVTGPADTTAPAAPTLALAVDSGPSATDHITNSSAIKVSGLEAGTTWEFSYDKGAHWTLGTSLVVNGSANLDTGATGAQTVMVRSTDSSGNVSAVSSLDYTAYKYLSGYLQVTGKGGPEITSNTLGLKFNVMLSGHTDGVTTTYQVSSTGQADSFTAWDPAHSPADGTYYFRATGSDLAGNTFTSNVLTVHLDNTAPPAPTGVALQSDSGIAGDGITDNGNFIVSGLQKDVLWQFSSDGQTWYQGVPPDANGNATGFAQSTGEQTLQVRTYDAAGNTSEPVTLHFTLDNHLNALNLSLNGADPTSHQLQTTASAPDLVFSYTGTINAGDTFDYTPEFMGDDKSTWTKIDGAMIDTQNKTITLPNFDLSHGDVFLTLRGVDAAGTMHYQASIDGPYTSYFTSYSAAGLKILLSAQSTAQLYVTDGANSPVQVKTLDANGDLNNSQQGTMVGEQSTAIKGVLGAGHDTSHLSAPELNGSSIYAFGTSAGETLSGNLVWGFGGDDTINPTADASAYRATISGGAGADTIHTETLSSQMMYGSTQESFLAADGIAAHGFDTVYVGNGALTRFSDGFSFEGLKLGNEVLIVTGAASFSGSETGTDLLAAMNTALAGKLQTGADVLPALISFGADGAGDTVNFLVVDANNDGHIGSEDYVIKVVGSIDSTSSSTQNGNGMVFLDTHVNIIL
jgi:hypothetical protein